jgi:hypothetical protein
MTLFLSSIVTLVFWRVFPAVSRFLVFISDRNFLTFETVTVVPIQTKMIGEWSGNNIIFIGRLFNVCHLDTPP